MTSALRLRPVDPVADLDALFAVAQACEVGVAGADTTRADVESLVTSPDADLVDGTRVAIDADGSVVGFAAVEVDEVGREVFADVYVHPSADDTGWDVLLDHVRAFADWRATADPARSAPAGGESGWVQSSGCYANDEVYAAALSRAGMTPVRRFHRMDIEFDPANPPVAPPVPDGVELVVAHDDERWLKATYDVWRASFAEHWRHVDRTYDAFMAYSKAHSYDPTQWWVAVVDGHPVGICMGNEHVAELGLGYVSTLGVLSEHRGRGLARLMLEVFFADAHARGRRGVRLGVDTENSTGAPALYLAVGMTATQQIDAWERPIVA